MFNFFSLAESLAGGRFQPVQAEMQPGQGFQKNIQQKEQLETFKKYFVHNYFTTSIRLLNAMNCSPHRSKVF